MKILLQREAQTISDRELENNQQYLIDLFKNICNLADYFDPNFRRIFTIKYHKNHQKQDDSS